MGTQQASLHLRIGAAGLGGLLCTDLALVAADLLHRGGLLEDPRFLVTRERGFAEMVQYAKAGLAAGLLAIAAIRRTSPAATVWSVLLAVVALDDAFTWHERAGMPIAQWLQLPDVGSMRGNHIGELLFFAAIGAAAFAAIAVTWRVGHAFDRRLTLGLCGSVGLLALCAVVLDGFSALTRHSAIGPVIAVAEDGGEMLALSLVLFTVWVLALAPNMRRTTTVFPRSAPERATSVP